MSDGKPRINLADPDFEPTDEQLQELWRRAMEGVEERHQEVLRRMHEAIAVEGRRQREELLRRRPDLAEGWSTPAASETEGDT